MLWIQCILTETRDWTNQSGDRTVHSMLVLGTRWLCQRCKYIFSKLTKLHVSTFEPDTITQSYMVLLIHSNLRHYVNVCTGEK